MTRPEALLPAAPPLPSPSPRQPAGTAPLLLLRIKLGWKVFRSGDRSHCPSQSFGDWSSSPDYSCVCTFNLPGFDQVLPPPPTVHRHGRLADCHWLSLDGRPVCLSGEPKTPRAATNLENSPPTNGWIDGRMAVLEAGGAFVCGSALGWV